MVAMTSAILGPPRFGLVPMVCGYHSEFELGTSTKQTLPADLKGLDCMAECGIDWLCQQSPWGGEWDKMKVLGPNDKHQIGPYVQQFLDHAA